MDEPTSQDHWEQVYRTKATDAVSWYTAHLNESLRGIALTGLPPASALIDVGGGESTLVDDLLQLRWQDLTVVDLSSHALAVTRTRLGELGSRVHWVAGNILDVPLAPNRYDLWHDRAVFHFLTEEADRRRYVDRVLHALRPGGFALVGTFGPDGPTKCSGLDVMRYSPEGLHGEFGPAFELLDTRFEDHATPWGAHQQFVYCLCRRASS